MEICYNACCFTGHRNIPPAQLVTIMARTERLVRGLIETGTTRFLVGGSVRACLKSGGMPDRRGFFRWARRFDAGILCVFQVKSTRPSGKRCAGMAF